MLPVTTPGAEIVFEGTCNFRELGGYRAADGRHVRRGLLYRGCSLDTLQSPADRTKLESLHLRMAQHNKNGQAMAEHLARHPKVAWVRYPGLEGDAYFDLAKKYLAPGASGVVSFGVAGGRPAAETFMANLKLAQIATHVADARTCVLHPANATHRQMNDDELAAAGITPDLIRLSCGIEGTADLIADVEQALAAV